MKIYISDVLKSIDESVINNIFFNNKSKNMSNKRIELLIYQEINSSKMTERSKKMSVKKIIIIALAASLTISALAGAAYLGKTYLSQNEKVTEENQHFIGTEVEGEAFVENGLDDTKIKDLTREERIASYKERNNIITDFEEVTFIPHETTEFIAAEKDNLFFYPEQILINGAMSIIKQTSNSGWHLNNRDTVKINFTRYPSEIITNQTLEIGFICNGKMSTGITEVKEISSYEFKVENSGEYYFYFMSLSSDYLTLKQGTIEIELLSGEKNHEKYN